MAETEQPGSDTVSREAFDRLKADNEKLTAGNQAKDDQIAASRKVSTVESFLRSQKVPEEDIPGRVVLLAPNITDIPIDELPAALAEERFKPLVAAPTTPPPPADDDDGNPPPAVVPDATFAQEGGFGNQPNPGGEHQPVTAGKVAPGDDEYEAARNAAKAGDHSKMQKLYDDDRVAEPQRPY